MLYDIKLYTYANITSADKYDETGRLQPKIRGL